METKYAESLDSKGFQSYWSMVRRRWRLATGVFVLVFSLVAIFTFLQRPSYEAIGKILLKRKDSVASLTGLGGETRGELQTLGQTKDPIDTEMEVVTSDPLAKKTIEALDLREKGGKRLTIEDFLKKLTVKSTKGADVIKVSYIDHNSERSADVVNFLMKSYLQNNLYINRAEAVSARKYIEAQLPKTKNTLRRAEVELRKFKEANKVVALKEEAESAITLIAALENQSATAQAELDDAAARSNAMRNRLGMNSKDAMILGSISQSPAVQRALEELQKVQGDIAVQSARYSENHPTVINLRRKETALKTLLKGRVKGVLGKGKKEVGDNLQVGELRIKITEDLVKSEVDRLGLASRVAALSSRQSAYKQRVSNIPRLEQVERDLSRNLEVSQATYGQLLKKLQEIQVTENQNIGNARILAAAIAPEKPTSPKIPLNLLSGALLGGLFALVTIYIQEIRDKSIKTVEEAKKLLGYPLLAEIPVSEYKALPENTLYKVLPENTSYKALPENTSYKALPKNTLEGSLPSGLKVPTLIVSPPSPGGDAYLMLQAYLRFIYSENNLKTVVISSSVPREGKSTVAANLAAATAQVGRKALLIDANMHRPRQHKIWSIPNRIGLSEIIMGQATIEVAIQKVLPSLDVLTAGTQPPIPLALLDSKAMSSFLKQVSKIYDLIILDTPSLVFKADAAVLGKMCDGLLLVVRPGVVDSASSAKAKDLLERLGQNVLGQVVNGVIIENEPYSYYQQEGSYYDMNQGSLPSRSPIKDIFNVALAKSSPQKNAAPRQSAPQNGKRRRFLVSPDGGRKLGWLSAAMTAVIFGSFIVYRNSTISKTVAVEPPATIETAQTSTPKPSEPVNHSATINSAATQPITTPQATAAQPFQPEQHVTEPMGAVTTPSTPTPPEPITTTAATSAQVTPEIAEQVLTDWQKRKANALGSERNLAGLAEVLTEPELSRWKSRASRMSAKAQWNYTLKDLKISKVNPKSPTKVDVTAEVSENAEYLVGGKKNEARSYSKPYKATYTLVKQKDQWKITYMKAP